MDFDPCHERFRNNASLRSTPLSAVPMAAVRQLQLATIAAWIGHQCVKGRNKKVKAKGCFFLRGQLLTYLSAMFVISFWVALFLWKRTLKIPNKCWSTSYLRQKNCLVAHLCLYIFKFCQALPWQCHGASRQSNALCGGPWHWPCGATGSESGHCSAGALEKEMLGEKELETWGRG